MQWFMFVETLPMSMPLSHNPITDSLLSTKLFIPQVRQLQGILARPRLVEQVQAGLARRLTLISAPAGYGKTILVTEWIAQSDRAVAWLSLDETDNDLPRFLTYAIAALQMLKADLGQGLLLALHSPQPPDVESLITTLVNEITHTLDEFVLVLDDYHLIQQPAIHAAVAALIQHAPPNLHLILTSRADPPLPLARLRVRGQMTEIRAADLRFTPDETAAFFRQLKNLSLAADQIKELETRTEGWGAGLHLAALSLQGLDRADISDFIGEFTGSHHNVFDYLAEEVFQQQPEEIRRFLLHSSILSRLCGPLCDAILNGGVVSSQEVLTYLEHANLFLVPLDSQRYWYRYHHLFVDFLRNRLTREIGLAWVNDLHRRASGWFEQHGLSPEAVQHALAAGDGTLAARLIEPLARPMQLRGEMTTLMGWLVALPTDVLRARPQLGLIYAWGLTTTGQLLAAERWLQDMERELATPGDHANLLGEVTVILARLALIQGDFPRAYKLARQAIAHLSAQQSPLCALNYVSLGSACIALGHLDTASQSFTQASTLYQSLGQPLQALLPLRQLARVQLAQGRLKQLEQTTQNALQLVTELGSRSPLEGYTYISLGDLWYERNDLVTASRYYTDGLLLVELGSTREVLNLMNIADAHLGLARLKQAQGDPEGALELIRRIETVWGELMRAIQPRSGAESGISTERTAEPNRAQHGVIQIYFDLIAACQVWLWLHQGNLDVASQWMQSREWRLEGEIPFVEEIRYITLTRVLLAQGEYDRALALLARLLRGTEAVGRLGRVIELLALQSLALHAHEQKSKAINILERALLLAEPEGYIRTFVDLGPAMAALLRAAHAHTSQPAYITKLLAAFSHVSSSPGKSADARSENEPTVSRKPFKVVHDKSKIQNLVEPLSARELEILSLLAQGLTNLEIAHQIYISDQTVKVHTRNIYGKLGVNGRREAVAKARELGLLA